jgi:hypothetical protein
MEFEVSVAESGKYLVCRVFVPVTLDVAHRMAIALSELAEEAGVDDRLIDTRNVRNVMSVVDNYDLAYKDMDEWEISRATKVAALTSPGGGTHGFVIDAIRNAGFNLRVFHEEPLAIAWLEE